MSKPSSIVDKQVKPINTEGQAQLPSWGLILFLIAFMFLLKAFIYIKDHKRHGK